MVSPLPSSNVLLTLSGPRERCWRVSQRISAPGPPTEALTQQTGWEGPGGGGLCSSGYFISLVCGCLTTAVKTAYKLGAQL